MGERGAEGGERGGSGKGAQVDVENGVGLLSRITRQPPHLLTQRGPPVAPHGSYVGALILDIAGV